jgi:hypothetical protein
MSIFSAIKAVAGGVGKVAGLGGKISDNRVRREGDKVQQEDNASKEYIQVLNQFKGEFGGIGRLNRIMDFVNRLPRPMFAMTIWVVLGVRYLMPLISCLFYDMDIYLLVEIYGVLWQEDQYLIYGIIAFYFGGRFLEKRQSKGIASEKLAEILKNGNTQDRPRPLDIKYDDSCSGTLSNARTMDMVQKVAKAANADRVLITGADRTPDIQRELEEKGFTTSNYMTTQHGKTKGYKACDFKLFNNGKQIPPLKVAYIAEDVPEVGGVGVYGTFTHCDIRPRKEDGSIAKWGEWT